MIVCVPSTGSSSDAQMDDRFGRAPFFAFFNTDDDSCQVESNPHLQGQGGVGTMVVQYLVKKGVNVLIAPRLGGNAEAALKAASVTVVLQNPGVTVKTAYTTWKSVSSSSS